MFRISFLAARESTDKAVVEAVMLQRSHFCGLEKN